MFDFKQAIKLTRCLPLSICKSDFACAQMHLRLHVVKKNRVPCSINKAMNNEKSTDDSDKPTCGSEMPKLDY